jgi:hypothetical protein
MRRNAAASVSLSPAEAALADRLRDHVERLAGQIGPRPSSQPVAIDAVVTHIDQALRSLGFDVRQLAYALDGKDAVNLQVEVRGSHRPEEIVVLGAHYDTFHGTPGADDNASAVAGLLEVARLLQGRTPRRTLRLVAFANEEPPHFFTDTMGSRVYARACRARGETITAMLCLEMIGYYASAPGSQRYPDQLAPVLRRWLPTRGDFLAAIANARSWRLLLPFYRGFRRCSGLRLIPIALPERIEAIRFSDNSSFWDEDYPALMVTDTSFMRNPHYHQATDTPETLDYPRLALATLGIAGATAQIAGVAGPIVADHAIDR